MRERNLQDMGKIEQKFALITRCVFDSWPNMDAKQPHRDSRTEQSQSRRKLLGGTYDKANDLVGFAYSDDD